MPRMHKAVWHLLNHIEFLARPHAHKDLNIALDRLVKIEKRRAANMERASLSLLRLVALVQSNDFLEAKPNRLTSIQPHFQGESTNFPIVPTSTSPLHPSLKPGPSNERNSGLCSEYSEVEDQEVIGTAAVDFFSN